MSSIPYKGFCWSLGTTSFRTKNFNKTIEEQIALLQEFRMIPENQQACWSGNSALQAAYYDFMRSKGFVRGDAGNKPKDAREKTSGLVDIGLIDAERRLTKAGLALLDISNSNDFSSDNFFQIPRDSFLYLKQLLKTSCRIDGGHVRPFIVLLYVLTKVNFLSADEYTYLLPLCTSAKFTDEIIMGIEQLRAARTTIDDLMINRLLGMDNYQAALTLFLNAPVEEALICEIGLNRKSRKYDKGYLPLYQHLSSVYMERDTAALSLVYSATKDIAIGKWWRSYIFNTTSETAIGRHPEACKKHTLFDDVSSEREFKTAFFKVMHLFKAKATLSDYLDLNKRYFKTADVVLFEDGVVKLDVVPKHFFASVAGEVYAQAYAVSEKLKEDCPIEEIADGLVIDEPAVIAGVNEELGTRVASIDEARSVLEDHRYRRLQRLIDTRFKDEELLFLLSAFERRDDNEIRSRVTDNADVPTIFEYVLGILWYKISGRQGKILDYMKLSLDADLLPKTHAAGGEADIVYEYDETEAYPRHTLLLEATLADSANQRRMEMEPVSRHLGQHLIRRGNRNSYCVFATNYLNINVIADFRSRKTTPYYDSQDYSQSVDGMKIIPLQTSELKKIISRGRTYKDLYPIFEEAFCSALPPHEWYNGAICEIV